MRCSRCDSVSPSGARFCMHCGAPLGLRCGGCGAALPEGARFCTQCAAPVPEPAGAGDGPAPRSYTPKHLAERILTQRSALEGERKHVTVLFADLRDSTPLAEQLGPEGMHALMDRAFRLMLEEVHRFEGTVNQFLGDGILALFGAPVAHEDAPRRAVLAALGIQRALAPLDEEIRARHGTGFLMRIGIHSGTVVVGRIGDDLRMDYTAVGDTTHLAARLQQAAEPGDVLISDTTEGLVAGYFEVASLGALSLKGLARPVRAFRVVAERPVSGRIEAAATAAGLTPYVGRERELAALGDAFESARNGRGQVAFVVGEAGIGKSRLLHELRGRLEGEPHLWLVGHCSAYARSTPFQAIADAMRRRFGVRERDDDTTALAKLASVEASLGGDLAWTLPFVRHLLSLPAGDPQVEGMDAMQRRSQTYRALQARLLRAAEHGPVVFVVEDLHWVDPATEEFLAFLAESIPASRVLLVFTYRPGYVQPFGERSYHLRLTLQALSERDMTSMAGALVASAAIPDTLRQLIVSKAEGNPFFVEEVTKSLIEEGVLRTVDGRVELTRELAGVQVPDSIQDVLMARIDRLEEAPKRAIQIASVIGREFALRLLERISEAGERVRPVVEDLRALELIYEKAAHPELAFMFKHALTHDVAYQSVLGRRRRALHRIVATAIEELYPDRLPEHFEALAYHFEQAEAWPEAVRYHARSARKAADVYANRSALEHAGAALAIAARHPESASREDRIRLEELAGEVGICVSQYQAAAESYLRAAELCADDPGRRARNLARAAYDLHWGHRPERAAELADAALALARENGDVAVEAMALSVHDFEAATSGDFGVVHLTEDVERRAQATEDAEALTYVASRQIIWSEWRGDFRRTISLVEAGNELAGSQRLLHFWMLGQQFRGQALCGLGDYGRAIDTFRALADECERAGDRALQARALNCLGWCYAEIDCHDEASHLNTRSADLGRDLVAAGLVPNAPEVFCNASINLACNRVAQGDVEAALRHLEPVERELATGTDPWLRWRYSLHYRDALARVALARGDPERALQLADEELAGARASQSRKLVTRALELRGRALTAMDRRPEAEASLHEALAEAREIGYAPAAWRSLSLLGELAHRGGTAEEAGRRAADLAALVDTHARTLEDPTLAARLRGLGERLAADPLGAYR